MLSQWFLFFVCFHYLPKTTLTAIKRCFHTLENSNLLIWSLATKRLHLFNWHLQFYNFSQIIILNLIVYVCFVSLSCPLFVRSHALSLFSLMPSLYSLLFRKDNSLRCRDCVRNIYQQNGLRGFYKGITASYFGMTETVIHFVIYEALKSRFLAYNNQTKSGSYTNNERKLSDFFYCMLSGAISKTCATCIAYPHGK